MSATPRPTLSGSDSIDSWEVVDAADSIDTDIRAGDSEVSPALEDDFLLVPSDCTSLPAHVSTMLPLEATSSSLEPPDSTRLPGAVGVNKPTAGVADTTAGVAQLSLYPAHPDPAEQAMPAMPAVLAEVHDQSAAQQRGPEAAKAAATLAPDAAAGFAADAGMASGLSGEIKRVPASSTGLGCKRAAPEAALRPLRMRYTPYPAPSQGTTQSPPANSSSPPVKRSTQRISPADSSGQQAFLPCSISLQQQEQHGVGLMQLQAGQRLGGPPSRHLSSSQLQDYSDAHSPRLHAYTQSQMWSHLQNKVDSEAVHDSGSDYNVSGQPQAGVHASSNQQDCSREFQQWDPFETGHQHQQDSYAHGVMLQQQQHYPGGESPHKSCPQEENVLLQSHQQQQQQRQRHEYRPTAKCKQRYNSTRAKNFAMQQAEHKHNTKTPPAEHSLLLGASVTVNSGLPPLARGPNGGLPYPPRGPRGARGGCFDRHDEEEERALQEALEASAREYKEQHAMAVDADIVLPVHRTFHPLQRRTAESLPIRMDDGTVVWQDEDDSTGGAFGASRKWASSSRVGIVQSDETLHQFARRHKCEARAVAAINGLDPNPPIAADACILYPYQVLQLPDDPSTLVVGVLARPRAQVAKLGRNQSLEDFAEQHGTYASCVLAVNFKGLTVRPVVREGQVLQLP